MYVVFAGKVFQEKVDIQMGTNCASFLADIFFTHTKRNSYDPCSQWERNSKHLGSISLTGTLVMHYLMYPVEREIKDMTESITFASYVNSLLSIGRGGQLHTSIYDKRDDNNFRITKFFRSWV